MRKMFDVLGFVAILAVAFVAGSFWEFSKRVEFCDDHDDGKHVEFCDDHDDEMIEKLKAAAKKAISEVFPDGEVEVSEVIKIG